MPEGRAKARSKPEAKSIDGAEHNAMLNGVMAGAQIAAQTDA